MLSRIKAMWRRGRGDTLAASAPVLARQPLEPVTVTVPAAAHGGGVLDQTPTLPMPDLSPLALVKQMRSLSAATRQYLHPAGVADDLLRWCQQEGHVGWLTVTEVAAAWRERHAQIGISTCTLEMVLGELAQRPDVRKRRVRLCQSAEYAVVRRRLQIMGKNDERAILYFLPPSAEDAAAMAAARAAEIAAGNAPPAPATSKPGRRPAAATTNPVGDRGSRSGGGPRPGSQRAEPAFRDLFADLPLARAA